MVFLSLPRLSRRKWLTSPVRPNRGDSFLYRFEFCFRRVQRTLDTVELSEKHLYARGVLLPHCFQKFERRLGRTSQWTRI